jgi:hypothetical protein
MKYKQVLEGEWVQPTRKEYKMECCECGAKHLVDFRIHKKHIQFRMYKGRLTKTITKLWTK